MHHPLVPVATESSYCALAPGALPSSEEKVTEGAERRAHPLRGCADTCRAACTPPERGVHTPAERRAHLLRGVQTPAVPLCAAMQRVTEHP